MQARATAVFVAGLILAGSALLPDSVRRAKQCCAVPCRKSRIESDRKSGDDVGLSRDRACERRGRSGEPPRRQWRRQTKLGDLVYKGDVVQTGADGKVGITFTDGTAFNLSSNARMILNEFVYDPNGNSNSTLFSLTKGTFTFVAGKVAKTGDMKIDTPVATMGIRGTTPHVEISDDGSVRFSTLIEDNKDSVTEKRGGIQENNKRVAPAKRQAKRAVVLVHRFGPPARNQI